MALTEHPPERIGSRRSGVLVAVICALAVAFDGYDLSVFGATIPALLEYEPWGLDAAQVGVIASYALMGMLVGTLVCGFATDLLGRRRMLMISISTFSVFMVGCAVAPSPEVFGMFRFLAGIGLGGLLPTALALTVEFAPPARRNLYSALVSSAFSIGTIIAATLGVFVLPAFGFRPMYLVGALPLLVLVPLVWWLMPESVSYLTARGRTDEARVIAERYGLPAPAPAAQRSGPSGWAALKVLTHRPLLGTALVFGIATLIAQLFIYGLATWLPNIMRTAGYPLGSALSFLATMSVGAIVGASVLAYYADRVGPRRMAVIGFGIGVLSLITLSLGPPTAVLYVAVFFAGVGANGTAVVLNGFIATWFPAEIRASALGSIMTIARLGGIFGPILGGLIAVANLPVAWNFYAFLVPAAIGVLVVLLLPRRHLDGRAFGTPAPDTVSTSTTSTTQH